MLPQKVQAICRIIAIMNACECGFSIVKRLVHSEIQKKMESSVSLTRHTTFGRLYKHIPGTRKRFSNCRATAKV